MKYLVFFLFMHLHISPSENLFKDVLLLFVYIMNHISWYFVINVMKYFGCLKSLSHFKEQVSNKTIFSILPLPQWRMNLVISEFCAARVCQHCWTSNCAPIACREFFDTFLLPRFCKLYVAFWYLKDIFFLSSQFLESKI